ncbi:MAG: hypothetical protein NZ772_02380 [Cyanobacteria bacterium]|nr:hypothetical protein [Cyanobacteriota bacterium]MDW8199685.1 hypothetical protein [Cyanobacteriota bacterium SKYGB_h_bin112]
MSLNHVVIAKILDKINLRQELRLACRFLLEVNEHDGYDLLIRARDQSSADAIARLGVDLICCAASVIPMRYLMVWGPRNGRPLIFPAKEILSQLKVHQLTVSDNVLDFKT